MFTYSFKWHFIHVLSAFLVAFCLLSTTSHGQGDGDSTPPPTPSTIQTDINPSSVEQALVPEGVFAKQLAEALKLGPVPDEAKAEELLSGMGIEPKNGWIAEYPVTPAVLGDVEKGISAASDQKKIPLTKDQALRLVDVVKTRLGFDVNPGPNAPASLIKKPVNTTIYSYTDSKRVLHFTDVYGSIPKEYRKNARIVSQLTPHELSGEAGGSSTEAPEPQYIANPNPGVINNYYYEQGPPVVTYYSPPDPYNYLYSWVPYPFWSTGSYFPGFFVLNNFHRHVFFNRHSYFVTHHVGSGAFPRPLSVGPVTQVWPRHLAPDGRTQSRWFSTLNAQASARTIVTLNQNRNRSINGTAVSRMNRWRPPFLSAGNPRALGNAPTVLNGRARMHNDFFHPAPYSGARIFNRPAFNQRGNLPDTPRFYSPPVFAQDRVFRSHQQFGGRVSGVGGFPSGGAFGGFPDGGTFGGFHGGGGFGNHGGSFAGTSRGGRR